MILAEQEKSCQQPQAEQPAEGCKCKKTGDCKSKPKKDEVKKLADELEQVKAQLKEKEELVLRTAAEFDNFKKRTERERIATVEYSKAQIIRQLLPVMDNADRAAQYEQGSAEFAKGIEMIMKQLLEISANLGLTEVGKVGEPFDPQLHEAVMHIDDENLPENSIAMVLQKGYKLGDTVVRCAMVQVAN